MQKLINILKSVSDKNRLRILWLLRQKRLCVCELSSLIGITQPSVSKHLRKLVAAGLIARKQDRFWTDYYILDNRLFDNFWDCIKDVLAGDPGIIADTKKLKTVNRYYMCCKDKNEKGERDGSKERRQKQQERQ
jgi:ArsR family transcriptional regulator, arsenate/arsenite/antimonite-responsive transcriptional repressor